MSENLSASVDLAPEELEILERYMESCGASTIEDAAALVFEAGIRSVEEELA